MKASWFSPVEGVHIYKMADGHKCDKIAAFDMDSTLIVTSSGAKWPKDKGERIQIWTTPVTQLLQSHQLYTGGEPPVFLQLQTPFSHWFIEKARRLNLNRKLKQSGSSVGPESRSCNYWATSQN